MSLTGWRTDLRWLTSRAATAARLMVLQAAVHALGLAAALLCVRGMTKSEFAWFTITGSLIAALSVLADSGTGAGLQALAGRVWPDTQRLEALVRAARKLRRQLTTLVGILVGPPFVWLLVKSGAPWPYALGLACIAYATVWQTTASVVLAVPVRLQARYEDVQRADLLGASVRLTLLAVSFATVLNAGLATLWTTCGAAIQRMRLELSAASILGRTRRRGTLGDETRQLTAYLKPLAAPTLFFVLQGQITVWLVGVLGHVHSVADLGAVSRFAALFSLFGATVTQNAGASFARCRTPAELERQVRRVAAGAGLVLVSPLALLLLKPDWALLLLGSPYRHLTLELRVLAVASFVSTLTGLVWALDTARGWVQGAWWLIPATLLSQAAIVSVVDPASVVGALLLSLTHGLATLTVYLTLAGGGWRRWAAEYRA
jgi:hypothetical protein